jgi:hypothetical protein
MTFTIQHNSAIDTKIGEDLKIITSAVVREIGTLIQSVLLVGGFGRSEGSVYVEPGQITVLGDYDIFLCLRALNKVQFAWHYRRQQQNMHRLAEQLAEQLRIKQIDLVLKHRSYFNTNAAPTLEQYEVKHGHKLLYGNPDPCTRMPEWTAQEVPRDEFIRLLRNRGMGLLMAALYSDGPNFREQRENFIVEVNKAWLAIGDFLLYQQGNYHVSYRQRLQHLADAQCDFRFPWTFVKSRYRQALEFKLTPDWEMFAHTDLNAWWLETKQTWLAMLQEEEARRSGRPWQSWSMYAQRSTQRLPYRQIATNWLRSSGASAADRYRRLWYVSHPALMLASISLLLQARETAGYKNEPVQELAGLWSWGRVHDVAQSWSAMAKMVLAILHPQGEVARILNGRV